MILALVVSATLFSVGLALAGSTSRFIDIDSGSWYEDSLLELEEIGILQGYPDQTYRPDDSVNRAELAVALDRLLEYVETGQVSQPVDLLDEVDDAMLPLSVTLDVPFTAQAPNGDWNLPYKEACEEASLIMVRYFWEGESLSSTTADTEIVALVDWETTNGYGVDIDAQQTADITEAYYELEGAVYYDDDVTLDNIRHLVAAGYPVILPAAGQTLANPNYTYPGPPYHMIVVVGYTADSFLVHDPGTQFGEYYGYDSATLDAAIHDWNGAKTTIDTGRRAMVVLSL